MARYVRGESVRNLQPTDVFPSPKFRRKPFSFRARSDYTQRMNLLDPLFRSQAVEKAFSNRATLQAMLDFEAALARAEARAGFIPAAAAPAIEAKCRAELYDMTVLGALRSKIRQPRHPSREAAHRTRRSKGQRSRSLCTLGSHKSGRDRHRPRAGIERPAT